MTHMVTRCPKCTTAFRITTTQLESAKGSVRCGSCLHIFKANDNLVSTVPAAKEIELEVNDVKKVELEESADEHTSFNANIDLDDDILISDDMDDPIKDEFSYEFEGYMDIDLRPKQTLSLFERDIQPEPEKEEETVDESWAEELLGEDQEFLNALKNDAPYKHTSPIIDEDKNENEDDENSSTTTEKHLTQQDISRAIMERHSIETPDANEYARINQEFSNLYKTPLFSIVNDGIHEDTQPAAESSAITDEVFINAIKDEKEPVSSDESNTSTTTTFGTGFFRHRDDHHELPQTHKHPLKSQPAIHATPDSRATLLMNIAPSPIELTAQRFRSWSQQTHWPSLSIVAALILILQIAYFKFSELSKIEPYRTAYVWACPLLNCKVPGLVDPTKIIAYQLILRNHPDTANALLLDVMIRNDALFEQPFPDLILAFTTMDEKPVAARRFTPKEYLGGELAGMERMPSKQPVHITLELSDPGPQAVNYHMSIAP